MSEINEEAVGKWSTMREQERIHTKGRPKTVEFLSTVLPWMDGTCLHHFDKQETVKETETQMSSLVGLWGRGAGRRPPTRWPHSSLECWLDPSPKLCFRSCSSREIICSLKSEKHFPLCMHSLNSELYYFQFSQYVNMCKKWTLLAKPKKKKKNSRESKK